MKKILTFLVALPFAIYAQQSEQLNVISVPSLNQTFIVYDLFVDDSSESDDVQTSFTPIIGFHNNASDKFIQLGSGVTKVYKGDIYDIQGNDNDQWHVRCRKSNNVCYETNPSAIIRPLSIIYFDDLNANYFTSCNRVIQRDDDGLINVSLNNAKRINIQDDVTYLSYRPLPYHTISIPGTATQVNQMGGSAEMTEFVIQCRPTPYICLTTKY